MNQLVMKHLEKCRVLGVLDDGAASLSQTALAHLAQAQLVIGGSRTLKLLAEHIAPQAEQRDLTGAMSEVPEWIRAAQDEGLRAVVLAAANSMSDVYAMGGEVLYCLNIAAMPESLGYDVIDQIFAGGAVKVREAGAALAGHAFCLGT